MSENGEIVKTGKGTAEVFHIFFGNIVKNLNTSLYSDSGPIIENVNRILKAIVKYKEHSIILAIKTKCNRSGVFSFREVSLQYIETEIRLLKLNEASQYSDIPTKIIKGNSDIFSNFICESINNSIQSIFLLCLKKTDVTLLHKKCNESLKENYKPVSILPTLSTVFERSMFEQMSRFFYTFSKYQYGFRKGFSTQCLFASVINSRLLNRKQRPRINNLYSTWMKIVFRLPQGSILGPLLFNIFLVYLFFVINSMDIENYADENTPYAIDSFIGLLEKASESLFN